MSVFTSSGALFSIVRNASKASGKNDAIVAVVFSAMCLEAFINEKISCAIANLKTPGDTEANLGKELCEFARWGKPVVENPKDRTSTAGKYQKARSIFAGRKYHEEESPFKDFQVLMNLRNWLVHKKLEEVYKDDSGEYAMEKPSAIDQLEALKVIDRLPPDAPTQSDLRRIDTPGVARWAKKTVLRMIDAFDKSISNKVAKARLRPDRDMLPIPESDQ